MHELNQPAETPDIKHSSGDTPPSLNVAHPDAATVTPDAQPSDLVPARLHGIGSASVASEALLSISDGEEVADNSQDTGVGPADAEGQRQANRIEPPIKPPEDGPPPRAGESSGDEPSDAQQAFQDFEGIVQNPPSVEEREKIRNKKDAIDILDPLDTELQADVAFGGRTFGNRLARDADGSEIPVALLPRLKPDEIDKIVSRQLNNFGDTLTRVHENVSAVKDIADLAEEHIGRTLIDERPLGHEDYPETVVSYERVEIALTDEGTLAVSVTDPPRGSFYDELLYVTPGGEVQLIRRDLAYRTRIKPCEDRLIEICEEVNTIKPGDVSYLRVLSEDLARYENLLLQVAEIAGFERSQIVDSELGELNKEVLAEVDRAIASNPDFDNAEFDNLYAALIVEGYNIAHKLHGPPDSESGHHESALKIHSRIHGYFTTALRH